MLVAVWVTTLLTVPAGTNAGQFHRIDAIAMAWRLERNIAVASGHRSCLIKSLGGDVVVLVVAPSAHGAVKWSVLVGYDNPSGSLRYLRINKRYFTTAEEGFFGSEAEAIVTLLKGPGEFAFEWAQGPNYAKRQGLFATGDFGDRARACEAWIGETAI